jgi:hypothetical protein
MQTNNTAGRLIGAALLLLVLGQAWSLRSLRGEVRDLKASVEAEQEGATDRVAARVNARGGQARDARRTLAVPSGVPARVASERSPSGEGDEAELAQVVERAMSKRDTEQKERRFQQRMTMMEEGLTMQFGELSESFELTADQEEMATQLILASMEQGMDLRMQVGEGSLSMMEAKEEGATIKEETNQGVIELLGEDAAEALFELMGNNK